MNKNTHKAFNGLHYGHPLAVEIPANRAGYRRWVGVYPLDLNDDYVVEFLSNYNQSAPPSTKRAYSISRFELADSIVAQGGSIGETELENSHFYFAYSDEELITRLGDMGILIEQLQPHFKSDYPL